MSSRIDEILVIHHTHTDVGYTAQQSIVSRWNYEFIRSALSLIDRSPDFRWTCETFWGVERFLDYATQNERRKFVDAVTSGKIGLSASYLNFNELLDYEILMRMTDRAGAFGKRIGCSVDSAITADINGFGWGFARALAAAGVTNLLTCIHTHHGMYPLSRRHIAFWWEAPDGDRILVFNAEHYHFGNELGLVPGAVSSYIIKDECDADMIFGDHWKVAEIRIPRFVDQLSRSGYRLPIIPVMASGLRTDNAPPNEEILHCIERWNRDHADIVRIRMVTLSEFFRILRSSSDGLSVYRGDWPDWWSDGIASFPADTTLFRAAQRVLKECLRLGERHGVPDEEIEEVMQFLALYAEHTFSHADSVSRPWGLDVRAISSRKTANAALGYDKIQVILQHQLEELGHTSFSQSAALSYRIVNSWPHSVTEHVALYVSHYEFHELGLHRTVRVRSRIDGITIPHQVRGAPAGSEFVVRLTLAPKEELELEIVSGAGDPCEIDTPDRGSKIRTEAAELEWRIPEGIVALRDVSSGKDLIRANPGYYPFTPIYEVTPAQSASDMCQVRGAMDLNRKGANVVRTSGKLTGAELTSNGLLYTSVSLTYSVPGLSHYCVDLIISKSDPRVDISLRMAKDQNWSPENLYIPLALRPGSETFTTWFDKAGAAVRPRIDQIQGTLTDFYCVQEGIAIVDEEFGLAIATPDSPLVHVGDLEHRQRKLFEQPDIMANRDELYSWLMTNYWETNFAAGLGGFHEFRYAISWGEPFSKPELALTWCRSAYSGLTVIRIG